VLDWPHLWVLKAVSDGDQDCESPALRDLVATGLVEQRDDGSLIVTQSGRTALEVSKPSRVERVMWQVLTGCLGIIAIVAVVGWVT
jgi:hypothetical protein